MRLCRV